MGVHLSAMALLRVVGADQDGQAGLRMAVQAFPRRWSRPTLAVASTLNEPRWGVWRWCEALDVLEEELAPVMPKARALV